MEEVRSHQTICLYQHLTCPAWNLPNSLCHLPHTQHHRIGIFQHVGRGQCAHARPLLPNAYDIYEADIGLTADERDINIFGLEVRQHMNRNNDTCN